MPALPGVGTTRWSIAIATAAAVLLAWAGVPAAGAARAGARAAGAVPPCPGEHSMPTGANLKALDAATLCLIDRLRAAHGLSPLRPNGELARVAGAAARAMVREDYFADVGPSGRTPMSLVASTHYRPPVAVGQNIAWGTGANATPARVVAAWLASPAHREIMLDPQYVAAGAGAVPAVPALLHPNGRGATYVLELGARA
ncbi:MAG TPA: CAP domain-containing protein [Solirubrobacteraceae bacterium]|jgi:uncharacterized protein YkwD|nr:CAP domain-containing protein [Solirubrobacteraceae bacterium]